MFWLVYIKPSCLAHKNTWRNSLVNTYCTMKTEIWNFQRHVVNTDINTLAVGSVLWTLEATAGALARAVQPNDIRSSWKCIDPLLPVVWVTKLHIVEIVNKYLSIRMHSQQYTWYTKLHIPEIVIKKYWFSTCLMVHLTSGCKFWKF